MVRFEVLILQLFILPVLHLSSDAVRVKANLGNLKALKMEGENLWHVEQKGADLTDRFPAS